MGHKQALEKVSLGSYQSNIDSAGSDSRAVPKTHLISCSDYVCSARDGTERIGTIETTPSGVEAVYIAIFDSDRRVELA